jgi:hypothetical protein
MPRKAAKTLKAFKGGAPPPVIQIIGGPKGGFVPPMPVMALPAMDPLSSVLASVGGNPYTIGIFYIILNLGGRFLTLELTKRQEWFLAQPIMRPFILFAVMFIATRNLPVAFYTTIGVLSVMWLFANENSAFCMIPGWRDENYNKEKIAQDKSYEDTMKAIKKHHDVETPEPDHPEVQLAPPVVQVSPPEAHPLPTELHTHPPEAQPVHSGNAENDDRSQHSHAKTILERPDITNDNHKPEHTDDLYH